MFVKKLVEKAAKKAGGNSDGLKPIDVEPRVVFHYGIPSGANMFAYDSIQKILAIATKDGRIKLYGEDNTQALLEPSEAVSSKFLQFFSNKGILINVTSTNQIEVWDIEKRLLSDVYVYNQEITSFSIIQCSNFMYIGDSEGNVSVLKLDQNPFCIVQQQYRIPLSASHGNEVSSNPSVIHTLPLPTAESKRVLIIFRDGLITLWDLRESKSIYTTGRNVLQSLNNERKQVTCACWVCPVGTRVALGYSNGEIFIWEIPSASNLSTELSSESGSQNTPICKLNLGYKMEKVPVASLKWVYADGKASRLYVMGASDSVSANLLQVVLLNEQTETRTIKVTLSLSEPFVDMEITSTSSGQTKNNQDSFLLLGKSGHIYYYDDSQIERYLLQYQSRSPPSLPKEVMMTIPFLDSRITAVKFYTDNAYMLNFADEEYISLSKTIPSLLPFETKPKDASQSYLSHLSGFAKVKNLFITGHSDGAVNFWDVSCPFLIPVISLKQQSENDLSLSGVPVTAVYFEGKSCTLVSGDQSGMVRIFKFKAESHATSFSGCIKKGISNVIHSVKVIKVNGSVISFNMSQSTGHLAIGSDQGYVYIVDIEGPSVIYEKHIASEVCTGIISLQFETCNFHGFDKNVLVVATKDSSVLALDSDTGNTLGTDSVHPKKPSRALFMQILDGQDALGRGVNVSNGSDLSKGSPADNAMPKQLSILICSEKAAYVYSLTHVVQGIKKVHYKKKFHSSSCCWASTFYSGSDMGLVLLFTNGRIEIRSLPELSLLKETSIRGFTYSTPRPNSLSDNLICSSWDGELIMVNSDQEISFVSVLLQKEFFRLLDCVSQVYRNDQTLSQEELNSGTMVQKEKKKGLFSSVLKDMKGSNKSKRAPDVEVEDTKESIEELLTIFSTTNFPVESENTDNPSMDADDTELNIDDIDIDYIGEKPKEQSVLAAFNKQKLTSKFQAFKGKLKQMTNKNEKSTEKSNIIDEQQYDKGNSVDQIKKKYGFSMSTETSAAKMAESKLHENVKKLEGINLKTTEMQDTAKSFSSMAKEVLRIAENDKRST